MSKRIVLLQALAATPADLQRLLATVSPAAARQVPPGAASDHWSIATTVRHLLDVETRYRERLQRIVAEDQPQLPAILPPPDGYRGSETLSDLLASFAAARAETLAFLKSLSAGEWQRRATHPSWGELTLRFFVQRLVDHDTEHLNQLALLKQQAQRQQKQETAAPQSINQQPATEVKNEPSPPPESTPSLR